MGTPELRLETIKIAQITEAWTGGYRLGGEEVGLTTAGLLAGAPVEQDDERYFMDLNRRASRRSDRIYAVPAERVGGLLMAMVGVEWAAKWDREALAGSPPYYRMLAAAPPEVQSKGLPVVQSWALHSARVIGHKIISVAEMEVRAKTLWAELESDLLELEVMTSNAHLLEDTPSTTEAPANEDD